MRFLLQFWRLYTILIAGVILILSLWPLDTLPQVPGSDKTHHFIAYACLMLPCALTQSKRLLFHFLLFFSFSGIIELLQPLSNRYCDIYDLLANGAGLLLGLILGRLGYAMLQKQK